jgi:hypothetical protein
LRRIYHKYRCVQSCAGIRVRKVRCISIPFFRNTILIMLPRTRSQKSLVATICQGVDQPHARFRPISVLAGGKVVRATQDRITVNAWRTSQILFILDMPPFKQACQVLYSLFYACFYYKLSGNKNNLTNKNSLKFQ